MTLLDEVTVAAEAAREERKRARLERREELRAKAEERFAKAFGEGPDEIRMGSERLETHDGPVDIFGRLQYQGVAFALAYERGGHPAIHAVLTCPECGREFLSQATFYGYLRTRSEDRARNVERLAEALQEPVSGVWRHQCRENVLGPVRYVVKDAARKLGVPAYQVLGMLGEEAV